MPPKGLNVRSTNAGVHVPAHPVVPGAVREPTSDLRTVREMRLRLRDEADELLDMGDLGGAAERLLELGSSLISTQSYVAGIMVLDEALDTARASGERALVERAVHALDRAIASAGAR